VSYEVVSSRLDAIQKYAGRFETVLSLNYDLILYWAMLAGNESRGFTWFKDCWISGEFDVDWERFRESLGGDGSTLVFYPHGNLVLATDPSEGEVKLAAGQSGANLLHRVVAAWQDENYLPLFVSEGESSQKEAAIARHGYLNTVFNDVMLGKTDSVACYGWSVAENDDHILGRICRSGPQRMAMSIYRGGRSDVEVDLDCQEIALRVHHHSPSLPITFFDSASSGCWANP
jgi:hypothetical protein